MDKNLTNGAENQTNDNEQIKQKMKEALPLIYGIVFSTIIAFIGTVISDLHLYRVMSYVLAATVFAGYILKLKELKQIGEKLHFISIGFGISLFVIALFGYILNINNRLYLPCSLNNCERVLAIESTKTEQFEVTPRFPLKSPGATTQIETAIPAPSTIQPPTSAVTPTPTMTFTPITTLKPTPIGFMYCATEDNVNIRDYPALFFESIATTSLRKLSKGECYYFDGRNDAKTWLRLSPGQLGEGEIGWVSAKYLIPAENNIQAIESIRIITPISPKD